MNHKKILIAITVFCLSATSALALSKEEATSEYVKQLTLAGLDEALASEKAASDVEFLLEAMEGSQYDLTVTYEALEIRVDSLNKNDSRHDAADEALKIAEEKVIEFTGIPAQNSLDLQDAVAGTLPRLIADLTFELAQITATEAINGVNQILIVPDRPGDVPATTVEWFLSQLIRQLFRFAWLFILVAFIVSGIFFILAKDNEERVTKARNMILYSLVGFAVISLAFAFVKGFTAIDFFAFI